MIVLPRIGQLIRINQVSPDEQISKQTYKSRVADIQSNIAAIELPIHEENGRTILLAPESRIEVSYLGEDGSRYHFETEVVGERKENIRLLLIRMPEKEQVMRTQRRSYLRVEAHVEVAVKIVDTARNYHFLARTSDLSGGGLAFTCPEHYRFKQGDRLMIWMALPHKTGNISHAFAEAEVTRSKAPDQRGAHQWVSVKFAQISQADQSKVVRACYDRQLELRKKNVGE